MFGRRTKSPVDPTWDRPKLLALLLGSVAVAALVVVGLVLAVVYAFDPERHADADQARVTSAQTQTGAATPANPQDERDRIANAPMPSANPELAKPGPVSTRNPGVIVLPRPTRQGPAGVPSGYPRTPAGALAQLAAIDQTALQSGNLASARAVIAQWAAPGGPTPESWSGTALLARLLESAGLSGGGSPQFALRVTPLMGLIKGTVGTDFVVPCIDFEFQVTLNSTARAALADCQRMVWHGDRWLIGPGPEPAPAPSVWPDTDAAIDAGYKDLRHG